jgi:SNF2 family DNA or RNA helicase
MRMGIITNTLVIVPVSVLRSWENESHAIIKNKCVPNVQISVVSSDVSRDRRVRILQEAMMCTRSNPTLIITTYGLIGGDYAMDFRCEGHPWNYVILDEGHKIKNTSTKVAKNCRYICNDDSTRRLLLTGTPIMNNLKGMCRC